MERVLGRALTPPGRVTLERPYFHSLSRIRVDSWVT
jgi:hypothetical protein